MSDPRTWIQGYHDQVVTPLELKPEQVSVEDIAHALSLKCRFTGQSREFYSVAQHSLLGALKFLDAPCQFTKDDYRLALAFLLHDSTETYLPDISSPLKPHVAVIPYGDTTPTITWAELETQHLRAILKALDLLDLYPVITGPQVKNMDVRMLETERLQLLGPAPKDWHLNVEPFSFIIQSADVKMTEKCFLACFNAWRGEL